MPASRPLAVAALAATVLPLALAQGGSFADEFDLGSDPRRAGWTILNEDADTWTLSGFPGNLTIGALPGTLQGPNGTVVNDVKNVFLREAPAGDFLASTLVRFFPTAPSAHAGLVLYEGPDDYFFIGRAKTPRGEHVVEAAREQGGSGTPRVAPFALDEVHLRVARVGDVVTVYASRDAVLWTIVGSETVASRALRVGLLAAKGPGANATPELANFDHFRLEGPPASETRTEPPAAALAADRVAGVSPVTVNFTLDASYDYPGVRWFLFPGDGSAPREGRGLPARVTHTYEARDAALSFTPTLRLANDERILSETNATIAVSPNLAPRVTLAASPASPLVGTAITVTATVDARDSEIASWSFDADGAASQSGEGAPPATFALSYDAPGERTATLLVRDALGREGSGSVTVDVRAPDPPPGEPTPPSPSTPPPSGPTQVTPTDGPTPATAPPEEPTPPAQGEEADAPTVRIVRGESEVTVARGDVSVEALGVPQGRDTRLVLRAPDGSEEVLSEGGGSGAWNTSAYENGFYTVELRERRQDGSFATVASTSVLVENPRATPAAAVAAVATGAVVSAGAGALAARGFDLFGLLKQSASEIAGEVAEDKARSRTAGRMRIDRKALAKSLWLVPVAVALVAFFKAFAERESFADLLATLPIAAAAILAYTASEYSTEILLARASGATARFRLWAPGALSLVLSSVFLRSAFGYPGYVDEDEEGDDDAPPQRRLAGLRALAVFAMGVGLALPFSLVGRAWRWDFAEFGIGVALMMTAASAMPFRPMPGHDAWRYNRAASLAAVAALVALYVLWQLALLPLLALEVVGGLGLLAFAGGYLALRRRGPT